MAIIKCKMCGGDLNLIEGASTAECEFCGSIQTIPNLDDEKKLIQFERAERLRKQCEFDKAAGIYETIVADFRQEAEAYWGLVLCKYGIEYVDDPATGKKIPTCHRSSFDSIMEDSDFEQALENADSIARKIYREEAKAIEEIRKGIISVSSNEQPYDIFICYKETAENGNRTLDSVLAQDVYDALTDKGYRVFFSRISLEDKLGVEYEPYIFAALNSAKIMLAFGTDYEYFNAVWVKNEWSRFLKLMATDKDKHLIPCFKGIDAYDMPKEFARLQAQDLGKVGAIQDLLRGIEKIIPRQTAQPAVAQERVVVGGSSDNKIASLLDRGNMALEDGDWDKADSFFEDVLNNDSKNAQAYLGKTLAMEKCRTIDAFIRKRKTVYAAEETELKYIQVAENRIQTAADKFCVPGFVSYEDIKKVFDYNLSFPTAARCRLQQYRDEKNYWENHKSLSRAEQFATGSVAQNLQEAKEALFTFLSEQAKKAKEDAEIAKTRLEERYALHLEKADKTAEELYQSGIAQQACYYQNLVKLSETSNSVQELKDTAEKLRKMGDYQENQLYADRCLEKCEAIYSMFAQRRKVSAAVKARIAVSPNVNYPLHMVLDIDGNVHLSGTDKYRDDARHWTDIAALSMGEYHALGLDKNGKVLSVGDNQYGQCNVTSWSNIVAIAAGGWHSVGLRTDGTVVAVGINKENECMVSSWKNIKKICAGKRHTVGLRSDGTVVATGLKDQGRCDVSTWRDIVDIFAFNGQTVGLKSDGTVLVAGAKYRVSEWRDIVTVSMGYECMLGLKKDGTALFAGKSNSSQNSVNKWTDIVDISTKNCHCAGLRADGTVVAVGLNEDGQCNVDKWRNVIAISICDFCTLGIQKDGTVFRQGDSNIQPYTESRKWKLFDNAEDLDKELSQAHQRWELRMERRAAGFCQHCGGELKGFFSKKCIFCGKPKDY